MPAWVHYKMPASVNNKPAWVQSTKCQLGCITHASLGTKYKMPALVHYKMPCSLGSLQSASLGAFQNASSIISGAMLLIENDPRIDADTIWKELIVSSTVNLFF
jgi:hypothetical protein